MEITASMVKELREKTDCPMMDCKKALTENGGDLEKAIDYLRKKGLATAKAKAERAANEGVVYAILSSDNKSGVLVEVNCETDFVARTAPFQTLAKDIAEHIMAASPKYLNAAELPAGSSDKAEAVCLLDQPYSKNKSVKMSDFIAEKVASIKENLGVKRFASFNSGLIQSYIHMGAKLGVLIELEAGASIASNPEFQELSKDIAMQIAAANPQYVERTAVPAEKVEKEKEVYRAQMAEQKKPANVIEKIIDGKLNKFYEDICLLDQPFIKEPEKKVRQHIDEKVKSLGSAVTIKKFVRFEIGK